MTFGDKLRELRTGRGMTQERLADAAGVPVGTIRDYEQGKRDPLLSNAQRLAGALGVSLDAFPAPEEDGKAGKSKAAPRPTPRHTPAERGAAPKQLRGRPRKGG